MNTQQHGQIRITREEALGALSLARQLVAAASVGEVRPDDRSLPAGFRWVKGASGAWVPLEDVAAC
jgi:hypothetical protein